MASLIINGKNTGRDVNIVIKANPGGQSVKAEQLGIMTSFDCKTKNTHTETKSIINGGQTFSEVIPHGLTATMKFSRYNAGLSDLIIAYRDAWKQGVSMTFTMSFHVQNRDRTVDTYTLVEGKPLDGDLGNFQGDQDVTQSITFEFRDIQKSGGGTNLFKIAS